MTAPPSRDPAEPDLPTPDPPAPGPVARALSFLGDRLEAGRSLAGSCTYRVGGAARWFVEVSDADELVRIAGALAALGDDRPPTLVVGRGSNLLVADRGFDGLALVLGNGFSGIRVDEGGVGDAADTGVRVVRAGAGAALPVVARRTVREGLAGFEWAVGVPGSIGGAVRMNAGGHGADMAAALAGVRVVDLATGEDVRMSPAQLDLGYRSSSLRPEQVVVEAELALAPGAPAVGEALLADIVRWRREHQPGGANAGSVFTNPPGDSAGRLIDVAGLRGRRVGSAHVSEKHANFIQTEPGGSADDVVELMGEIVEVVRGHSGVELHPETVLVGFDTDLGRGPS